MTDKRDRYIPVGGVPLGGAAAMVHPVQMQKMNEITEAIENIEQPEMVVEPDGDVDGWADLAEVGFDLDDADGAAAEALEENGFGPDADVADAGADFGGF